jgi:AcrR family transcriptional regulator
MARMTRAQQQERTRVAVLAAAAEEFAELGYADAKIDRIAERAELTRGAVYSNFPSKRALYLAVLVDLVERADTADVPLISPAPAEALGALARVWLERLPLSGDSAPGGRLRLRSLEGVADDEAARAALRQVAQLEALLLGLALESGAPGPVRRVRLAEVVLTLLHGASHLAGSAPGFGDPFDVVRACEHLADADLPDAWDPPHLPFLAPAAPRQDAWDAPAPLADQLTGHRVGFEADGVVAVLGTARLGAAEEVVRAARPGDRVTVAVVTEDPGGLGRLVRLRVRDLAVCLRRVFAPAAWPRLRLVMDDDATVATAAGLPDTADDSEAAVRLAGGRVIAAAQGRGAGHAAATAPSTSPTRGQ